MLDAEPPPSGDARLDALFGTIGEYLTKQHRLPRVPASVGRRCRVPGAPWFAEASDDDGMRDYLSLVSPAEFIHHTLSTDPEPSQRAKLARGPAPERGHRP